MSWNHLDRGLMSELRQLQQEFNRVFLPMSEARTEEFPFNVWSSADRHVMTALIPGADPTSIDVSIVGDTVTVRGKRAEIPLAEGTQCLRRERPVGEFVRSFRLPNSIDAARTTARYEAGVLALELAVSPLEQPRKIPLKTA